MRKNILVLSSSLRKESNSEILADSFIQGAREAGHKTEKVTLKDKKIAFCRGCLACQRTGRCVIEDDAVEIADQMKKADVIVFATPVYYYAVSGQLKTMLDRGNSLFASEYTFDSVYLLASAAEDDSHAVDGALKDIEGWVSCFERAELKGYVLAGGVDAPGTAEGHPAVSQAYEMGAGI